jgi:hypothetical protein
VAQIWAGTDIGKTHHHCVVLDAGGGKLLSRRVLNENRSYWPCSPTCWN